MAREIDQEGDRRVDDVPGRRRSIQQVLRELELARHRCVFHVVTTMRIGALASEAQIRTSRFFATHSRAAA